MSPPGCATRTMVAATRLRRSALHVLGHEGAGIVEAVGEDVRKVAPGDPVVLTYMWCGHCRPCYLGKVFYCENVYPLCFGGARLDKSTATRDGSKKKVHDHFFGQSSFGTLALANERNVVKVPKEAPLERLGPLGCGIQTGAGAVMNALKVRPGTSFVVFGAGAVGLSAVMAARICGATTIIAADVVPSRLETAKELVPQPLRRNAAEGLSGRRPSSTELAIPNRRSAARRVRRCSQKTGCAADSRRLSNCHSSSDGKPTKMPESFFSSSRKPSGVPETG